MVGMDQVGGVLVALGWQEVGRRPSRAERVDSRKGGMVCGVVVYPKGKTAG